MSKKPVPMDNFPQRHLLYDGMKRLLDVIAAVLLLIVLALPFLVIALVIHRDSSGGVFYRQLRVGKHNRLFLVYKFRTMYSDADRCGPQITSADDSRITPLGRFLRNHKLDELPQLLNVLKGEMSLVGPRPQVPRFVAQFPPEYRAIVLAVRPGITGPTQLKFRCEEQMLEGRVDRERYYIEHLLPVKCRMDVDYVQQRSLVKDLRVLWDTAGVVIGGMLHRFTHRQPPLQAEAVVIDPYRNRDPLEEVRDIKTTLL